MFCAQFFVKHSHIKNNSQNLFSRKGDSTSLRCFSKVKKKVKKRKKPEEKKTKDKETEMATTCELSKYQIRGLCQSYLDNLNTDEGVKDEIEVISYEIKPTSNDATGFLGRHQYLNVRIAAKDGVHFKNVRFFLKSAPIEMERRMEYLEAFGVFKKEMSIMRDVLPQLERIFPGVAPKCYYASNNLLVFEDLTIQGYKMGSGRDGLLNYEHMSCALKCLAALHASSIVFEVRQGKQLNEMFPATLKENAYPFGLPDEHLRMKNFLKVVDCVKEMVKTMPKYSKQLDFILETLPLRMRTIFEKVKTSTKYKNVLLHGDLWSNNFMFLYGKHSEIPIQCRLVDFQLVRYGPPLLDVMTVLTIPTSREFRTEYLETLLIDYYRFMSEFLKYEGLSIDDYIPKEQYTEAAEEFRLIGLIESCCFSHMTVLPPALANELTGSATGFADFFDHKRVELCMKAFNTDAIYRERLTDMIEDLVDRYVLSSKL